MGEADKGEPWTVVKGEKSYVEKGKDKTEEPPVDGKFGLKETMNKKEEVDRI